MAGWADGDGPTDPQPPSPDRERAAATAQLRSVLDHAPIVLWAIDRHGRFTLSEGRGLKALGLRPGQVLGMSAFEIYAANSDIQRALRQALGGQDVEIVFTEGGRTFENRIVPVRREDDQVVEVLGVSIDVTERFQAERERASLQTQLLQMQKLESLGLLAGGIAHDFNNILTVIESGASAAQLSLPPGSPAGEDIEAVRTAARRAADLTRQLLAYSGRAHFEIKLIDLSREIRGLAALLEASVPKKVALRLELAADVPPIKADIVQLQQVIMNLVINAGEAVDGPSGTVTVSSAEQELGPVDDRRFFITGGTRPGRHVVLSVQDTGMGMDDLTKAKIFDPFFTTKFTGRGLGLAAVLGIVRAHDGALSVQSTPGVGTTFKVFFPAQSGTAPAPAVSAAQPSRGGGLVLVIDDDEAVRSVTRRVLRMLGFEVIDAENGRAGLQTFAARRDEVRVVILDMTMPEMTGEETFYQLKKLRADVRVLLTSGYNEQEATRKFGGQGLVGFLQKPFTVSQLGEKLAAALSVEVTPGPSSA